MWGLKSLEIAVLVAKVGVDAADWASERSWKENDWKVPVGDSVLNCIPDIKSSVELFLQQLQLYSGSYWFLIEAKVERTLFVFSDHFRSNFNDTCWVVSWILLRNTRFPARLRAYAQHGCHLETPLCRLRTTGCWIKSRISISCILFLKSEWCQNVGK